MSKTKIRNTEDLIYFVKPHGDGWWGLYEWDGRTHPSFIVQWESGSAPTK